MQKQTKKLNLKNKPFKKKFKKVDALKNFLRFRKIISYPAGNKTSIMGMPKKILDKKTNIMVKTSGAKAKPFRKNWTSEYFLSLLTERGDEEGIDNIFRTKTGRKAKSDDTSDCCMMSISFVCSCLIDEKEYN